MDDPTNDPRGEPIERRLGQLGGLDVGRPPPISTLGRRRSYRRGSVIVVAAAVVAVVAGALVLQDDGDDTAEVRTSESTDAGDTWRTIAPSPLSPRDATASVWTGTEMLVVGGSDAPPCGPGADCNPVPKESYLADGAAYDPDLDSWRPIADAPEPLYGADAVWVDGQALVLAGWPAKRALYGYDPGTDTWTARAAPPDTTLANGVVVSDAVVYAPTSRLEDDEAPDWVYDPGADQWAPLPRDPIGSATDRSYVYSGGKLLLFALPPIADDGSWLFRAAILDAPEGDLVAGQWRMLPPSPVGNGLNAWYGVDNYAVNPTAGVNGDRAGGMLDLRAEQWEPLPPAPPSQGMGLPQVGAAGDYVVPGGSRIFEPVTATWHVVAQSPFEEAGDPIVASAGVWTGREVILWGGYHYDEDTYTTTLSAEGAAYTPPSGDPRPPPTTAQPTDTRDTRDTATPTTTSAVPEQPQPDPGTVNGTYDGIETIRLNSDRCPDMEHSLEADVTTADGAAGMFRAEYCGESTNSIWSGEGTFVFTLPDSSTLSGHFTSRAPLPTTGVPYSLTITDGTGVHEGATGYCDLTIDIERIGLVTQRQSGTFTCSVT